MHKFAAAVLAGTLALGAVAIPATTAQAQNFGFGLMFGDQRSDFFEKNRRYQFCLPMTDGQVRTAIANQGFTDISLNVMNDDHVTVRASQGGATYLLDYNYCLGEIVGAQRIR
jgi:hypothetical protein